MSTHWVAQQILGMRRSGEPTPPKQREQFGNRIVGQPSPGSATDVVLTWLDAKRHVSWWTQQQIISGTGCTKRAVDWALIFLRSTGRIEVKRDDGRNTRYLRYRKARSAE